MAVWGREEAAEQVRAAGPGDLSDCMQDIKDFLIEWTCRKRTEETDSRVSLTFSL